MNFDAHYQWLGIPPEEQPANHYRLLGLSLFEQNEDVIRVAAEQRQTFLRTFQQGPGAERSQQLLNEITQAKLCLLDPVRRKDYDSGLLAAAANQPAPMFDSVSHDVRSATEGGGDYPLDSPPYKPQTSSPNWLFWSLTAVSAVVVATFFLGVIFVALTWLMRPPVTEIASNDPDGTNGSQTSGPVSGSNDGTGIDADRNRAGQGGSETNTNGSNDPIASEQGGQPADSNTGGSGATPQTPLTVGGENPFGGATSVDAPESTGVGNPTGSSTGSTDTDSTNDPNDVSTTGTTSNDPQDNQPNDPDSVPGSGSPDVGDPDTGDPDTGNPASPVGPTGGARVADSVESSGGSSNLISVDEAELRSYREQLRVHFDLDLAAETVELEDDFVQLLGMARSQLESEAEKLAALLEARAVAWALLDLDRLEQIGDEIYQRFNHDFTDVDFQVYSVAVERAETNRDFATAWWLGNDLMGRLLELDRPAQAQEVLSSFDRASRGDAGRPYRRWVTDLKRDLDRWTDLRNKLPSGELGTLDPAELTPEQCQTVALWFCNVLQDWDRGLPFLAAGDHDVLKQLADSELQATQDAQGRFALAEAWRASAKDLDSKLEAMAESRALTHYRLIDIAELGDDDRSTVVDQLNDAMETESSYQPNGNPLPFDGRFVSRVRLIDRGELMVAKRSVSSLAISASDGLVAVGTELGAIHVAELHSRQQRDDLTGNVSRVVGMAWYPDSSRLISSTSSGELKTWIMRRGTSEDASSEVANRITQLAVGPKGRTVVGASQDGTLFFWSGSSGKILTAAKDHRRAIRTLSVSEDGQLMVTGGEDQKGQLWTGEGPLARLNGHRGDVMASSLSHDSLYAATGDARGQIFVWTTSDGQRISELPELDDRSVVGIAFLHQWPRLLVLTDDSRLSVFDLITQTWQTELLLPMDNVTCMDASSHGQWVVIGNDDGQVRLIEIGGEIGPRQTPTFPDVAP